MPESDQVQPRRVRPLPTPPPDRATGDGSGAVDGDGVPVDGDEARPVDAERWARWGVFTALFGWFVGLVGGAIAFQIVLTVSDTHVDDADSLGIGWVAVAQLGLWVGLLGAPWLLSRLNGDGMRRDYALTARWRDVPIGGLWGFAGQYAIFSLVYIPMSWFVDVSRDEFSEPAREMTDRATDPIGVVLLVLIVGIGAPIVEEIFYRGLLQRSLTTLLGPVWAIAIASLVFGGVHFQLLQLPALTLAGVLFGVLAHRYGRLGPAIAAHMVFNLTAVTALLLTS